MRGFRQMMSQMMMQRGIPGLQGARDALGRPMEPAGQPQFARDSVGGYPGYGQVGQTMDGLGQPGMNFPGGAGLGPVAGGALAVNALSGCIPPVFPIRAADRFCPMIIPLDTAAKVIPGKAEGACAGESVTFEVEIDCIFRLCTLRIPSNAAACLVVDSIIIRKTEQLGCGGDGEGSISGTFFSELATCCYCVACDLAWPSDKIKVTVTNIGNADIGDAENDCGVPGLIALVGEGLDFSQCAPGVFWGGPAGL